MQNHCNAGSPDDVTPRRGESGAADDDRAQGAVLGMLLDAHPAQRSIDEIVREMREMSGRPDEFHAADRAHRAIRDLVAVGLAHRNGSFIFAAHAAVRFDELKI
jgi:hypothetical protein